jgi:hypothetical protein
MTFSFLSCESYLGGDLNSDPNKPSTVPVTAQTPAIQIVMADVTGGAFSRFNSMLVQQVEGVARQWSSFNQYTGLTPNRFDAAWENIYENILIEIKSARQKAVDNDYKHYQGVLNVMEAYSLMIATDVWDDMPYTEALEGLGNLNPKFDKQTDIYAKIYSLIDEGISLLNGPSGSVTPGNEDVLYGGDISKWIKAAHALKARGLLKDNNYTAAMSEAQQAFASAADNFAYQYPDANDAGQWYRFNRDRTGDIEFHPTMKKLLTDLNDTDRLGVMDQEFITDHTYLVPNFLQEMITYREMQFIIAEADVRAGGTQAGYDAYLAGIKASFDRLGVSDKYDAYIAQESVNPGVGNLTLETVMTQKYIAMFLQPEVYSDWRRTAIPALTPVSGTTVPVRWNYAATEFLFNSNAPAESEVNIYTDKVGWNK